LRAWQGLSTAAELSTFSMGAAARVAIPVAEVVGGLDVVFGDDPATIHELNNVGFVVGGWGRALNHGSAGGILDFGVPRFLRVNDRDSG
jgi:hypothetical protein